ncbi:pentatricopeptide repeat-containing protein At2g34400 [Rosa rugosa]|uniref:pentatricopeptide repeat-containing protein At2g34400 n=1 Tax=Rosa rugosa TaxID=74645 RepID=UPI002B40A451|nr:pentatricopeptide repeat-containing protein At2g34400 [Rosa rugosa]XP_061995091.1 pentatricopeptide repeat-containing protein At2g34400 [Rosa rugosa]XP_061995092.1 pentatricopeptide repeat-containing protein At2g34400 [Rosa rugosa]XP_061995093.1 pentatricopeptide repeat-containing protein At2g34400 [Rosa rugosa]XP_061995094.1 pentatricopeptide repeat-containing protein At2g34400 [Rosa rugosa]XP_061995095.1 pentatricopeptide repeat-containing protein At2g34400 [Rosa rugosa]XP_061995096.1 pe
MLRPKAPSHLIPRQIPFENLNPDTPNQFLSLSGKLIYLLKQCVSTKELKQIHTQMLINSIHKPNFLLPKIIDLKDFTYASTLFSHIPEPNGYAFNVMLRGLTTTWQKYPLTLQLYYRMKSLGVMPDNFTYPFLFIACWNLSELNHGRAAHSSVLKTGLDGDGHVTHSLITMYSMCGELGYARKVFDEIPQRDSVSWNSMISGYTKMGRAGDAVGLFGEMREAGFELNEMTLVSVLGACGDLGDLSLGRWVEDFVVEKKLQLNSYLGSALIGMYGKCGDLCSARRVFDSMKKKDRVTWNAMITGYAQNGMSDEAMVLFDGMKEAGVIPDKITLVGMLSACAAIGALDLGRWIDKYASERDFQHDIYVATALVDMYAKCGSLANALRVFEDMPQKNEVSWNAMISALAFHGRAHEAISLFERMTEEVGAARPNDITFVAVLSACVHVGLVDEGRRLFDLMSSSFGLVPKVEHYSCMVDLLSRAGGVHEAWDFIKKMPEKPDEVTLGALLGACRKCGNVDITEQVVQLLLELEPSNSGNYVISSKIYAGLKMWDDSARMRVLMRQRGVSKTPGCSWIEKENQLHEFHAGDNLEEISQVLKVLYEDLKDEGYIPNINAL